MARRLGSLPQYGIKAAQAIFSFLIIRIYIKHLAAQDLSLIFFVGMLLGVVSFIDFGIVTSYIQDLIKKTNPKSINLGPDKETSTANEYLKYFVALSAVYALFVSLIVLLSAEKLELRNYLFSYILLTFFFFIYAYTNFTCKTCIGYAEIEFLQFTLLIGLILQFVYLTICIYSKLSINYYVFSLLIPNLVSHFAVRQRYKIAKITLVRLAKMHEIIKKIDFSVSLYQGVLGLTTMCLPTIMINLLKISEFNRFQTLSKIYSVVLGAAGMMFPNIWASSNKSVLKESSKIIISLKALLLLILNLGILSMVLYNFWKLFFPKVLPPSGIELMIWVLLTIFSYLNIQLFYELVSRKYFKFLRDTYVIYFLVFSGTSLLLYLWNTLLGGEILLLASYFSFTFLVWLRAGMNIIFL